MENTFEIKSIESEVEIEKCFNVALVLRPHLKKEVWVSTIREMVANEKYTLRGIYDKGNIISFVGYRIMTTLHSGHIIYIDDLCTLDSYRGKGLGSKLLSYVRTIAASKKMDAVVLDTGFNNHTAQKLYFKNGFELSAVHLHAYLK
ncbi:N-acetyltransferase [Flavobacterium sp. HSC-61S13]|uniref:GNAT family N-acetyltransferase n=1 Tax=Flavobacterium sp. HSC-61S13 TaxID=2910963 RepID=UPI00209F56F5|nr:GNAT family N-acetyltransferase [Flavobacterium sp. HSC-61S13]MCP1997345.1 ribosomal protein S18 acetylase RimI-like enzyme [Flavobacterium sp. HSC-61S13]